MSNIDRYGFFKDNEHVDTFTNYVQRLYPNEFDNYDWRYLPSTEIGYLFLVAYLLRYSKGIEENDFKSFMKRVEMNIHLFNEREKQLYMYAQKCLEYEMSLDFGSDINFEDKLLLKIMFDIMSSNYDLIMDRKFITVQIAKDYIEATRSQVVVEDHWMER